MTPMSTQPITAETVRSALIARIDEYQAATGKSDSAFGKEVLNDDRFVKRVRNGAGFNLKTYQRVIDWLDAHAGKQVA